MRILNLTLVIITLSLVSAPFGKGHAQESDVAWSYDGETGPEYWGTLTEKYRTCALGTHQSPIDIEGTEPAILQETGFHYRITPADIVHNGFQISLRYQPGSQMTVGDKTFALKAMQLRAPAEHSISGESFPVEIQFQHKNTDGEIAIVSVLVREGSENLALSEILPLLPLEPGQSTKAMQTLINARDFMPMTAGYYRYNGSLTIPPCAEGVNWFIMKGTLEASREQIDAIKGLTGEVARPTQPRGGRFILDSNQ